MIILPMPMAFNSSRPTSRCYSLVCRTADGRPAYIKFYGKPGYGREAFAAAQSVLRPGVDLTWDEDDERMPLLVVLLLCTMSIVMLGMLGFFSMVVANFAGLLSEDYVFNGGWGAPWTRTCLCLWPITTCIALIYRRLNRPGA